MEDRHVRERQARGRECVFSTGTGGEVALKFFHRKQFVSIVIVGLACLLVKRRGDHIPIFLSIKQEIYSSMFDGDFLAFL